MEEQLNIGVWEENGKVVQRDFRSDPYSRLYFPVDPVNLQKVLDLATALHREVVAERREPTKGARINSLREELMKLVTG